MDPRFSSLYRPNHGSAGCYPLELAYPIHLNCDIVGYEAALEGIMRTESQKYSVAIKKHIQYHCFVTVQPAFGTTNAGAGDPER